jgi:hypothetical protein
MTIKTLYRAGFDLEHLPREGRGWYSTDNMLRPDAFNIVFREIKYKDQRDSRLLIVKEDGTEEWQGPWAPCSDFARNKIDAVQLLRWHHHSTSFRPGISPEHLGGEEEMQKWFRLFAHRYEVCVKWLIDHGVKKEELWDPSYWGWWCPAGNNPAPRRLMVP